MNRRPRTTEPQRQLQRALITKPDSQRVFTRTNWRRLVDVKQEQTKSLLAEDLDKTDFLRQVDDETLFHQLRADLLRALHITIHGDAEFFRLVLESHSRVAFPLLERGARRAGR